MATLQQVQHRDQQRFENPFFQPDDAFLLNMIEQSYSNDPSLRSLSYLRMTSRKGLSVFQGEFFPVLFSKHPNDDETYIVYPPQNKEGYFDVLSLIKILKETGKRIEVIRVPEEDARYAATVLAGKLIEEKRLDYVYPVHIVDTAELIAMRGTRFLKFRNKINAIRKTDISVQPTDFSAADVIKMKEIVSHWAPLLFDDGTQDGVDYIYYALDHLAQLPRMKGLIVYQEDKPQGFTIWENPAAGYGTANSLIHCCVHERGMSELLHHEIGKELFANGVQCLSLGGAESEGLDAFKRKMNPCRSLKLATIAV